jgi:Zn-dependent protease with chaperone function
MRGHSILLCLVPLFLILSVKAQNKDFYPVAEDSVLLAGLAGKYQQHYQEELDKLPSKNRKDFVGAYAQRWANVKEKFDNQEIYTSPDARKYLDALVAEIEKANPSLHDHPFSCYFSRSAVPNASYIGEGIIVFNMGLFDRLDNESQAAFVLCHEIAHFLLQHSENSISKYVATINSDEVQSRLRKINGSEFRKSEQVEKLVKGLTFDSRRHSRDHEAQADSMGVELMRNTRFDLSGALSALALLDVIDTDTLNTASCLQQLFNAKNYPFRKKWIAREEGLLGGHAHLEGHGDVQEDSLKTHPDCQSRIRLLTPMVARKISGVSSKFLVDSTRFEALKNIFSYEVIEYAYTSDNYGLSLFLTMELLQDRQADTYGVAQVGRILNGLYSAQKGHRLSKVTSLPSPEYPSNYNLLLQFIQNLYLEDLASISYNYLGQYHPQMDYYRSFRSAYEQSARIIQ